MIRFLRNLLLFTVLCALTLMLLSEAYMPTQFTRYCMSKEDVYRYRSMPERIDIAVFGNSHSNLGFRYGPIDERTLFRFSYDAQPLRPNKKLYDGYCDRLADNALVLINLSFFSLEEGDSEKYDTSFLRHYCIILPFSKLPTAQTKWYRLFRAVDFDTRNVIAYACEAFGVTLPFMAAIEPETTFTGTLEPAAPDAEVPAGDTPDASSAAVELTQANLSTIALLRDWIADCQSHGFRPVLFTTPYYKSYMGTQSPGLVKKTRRTMAALASEYSVPYLDYSEDPRFADAADRFFDKDHLNQAGSEAFTRIILADADAFYAEG